MALEEIRLREIFKVLWRELRIGVLCGLALAAINFFRIYFMNHGNTKLALTVSGSLLATVIMAKTTGCVLPMLAKKINVDPAIMAAPLITTIVDAASLIIFFTVAKLMFGL